VRVLAARFPDRERASAALDALQRKLDDEVKAEIAPLASMEPASTDTLLAGHFPEELKAEVCDIVAASGGEIVADVDARWTQPRFRPGSSSENVYSQAGRGGGVAFTSGAHLEERENGGYGAGGGVDVGGDLGGGRGFH
jgi:hypothetical protein